MNTERKDALTMYGSDFQRESQKNIDQNVWGLESPITVPAPMAAATPIPYRTANTGLEKQTTATNNDLEQMVMNNQYLDEKAKEYLFRNQPLIQRLFPNKIDRLVSEMQGKMVGSALEFRLNLFKMNTEFKLEAVREHFNAILLTIRGGYRQQVADFMLSRLQELHEQVDCKQRQFIALAVGKLAYAQTLPPMLQGRYIALIDSESEGFLNFTQRQIKHFESIIDEQIKKLN